MVVFDSMWLLVFWACAFWFWWFRVVFVVGGVVLYLVCLLVVDFVCMAYGLI